MLISGTINISGAGSSAGALNATFFNLTGGTFNNWENFSTNVNATNVYVNGSSVTFNGRLRSTTVIVTGNLTHSQNSNGNSTAQNINITTGNLTIEFGGRINASSQGHSANSGPGRGNTTGNGNGGG